MTGGMVSAGTGAAGPPAAQRELAEARHTPSVEHLQGSTRVCHLLKLQQSSDLEQLQNLIKSSNIGLF